MSLKNEYSSTNTNITTFENKLSQTTITKKTIMMHKLYTTNFGELGSDKFSLQSLNSKCTLYISLSPFSS